MKQKLKIRTKWLLNLHDTKIGTMSLEIKNFLKGRGIFVTENLIQKRIEQLKKTREQHGFANVWALDGNIMFKEITIIEKFIILKWFSHRL